MGGFSSPHSGSLLVFPSPPPTDIRSALFSLRQTTPTLPSTLRHQICSDLTRLNRSGHSGSKEKISSLEDCISIGPWGGRGGKSWAYKPQGRISQIVVQHGRVVDSILFQSQSSDGLVDYSEKFGGPGGGRTELNIDYPEEHLTAMDTTVGEYRGYDVVTSVCFHTNVAKYGPFGKTTGTSILIPMESAIVVGFHGRSGSYLDAIGFFAKPQRSASSSSSSSSCVSHDYETINAMKLGVVPRDPGPWGGSGGKHWDDGVFSTVMKVNVYTGNDEKVVRAVKFKYMKRDGDCVWSLLHGYSGTVNEIKLDYPREEIVGIEGYHGAVEGRDGSEAITSISFHTNMGKYGPFGEEVGTYFSSTLYGGKVVGFSGRSGSYLNAIGVHMEYF